MRGSGTDFAHSFHVPLENEQLFLSFQRLALSRHSAYAAEALPRVQLLQALSHFKTSSFDFSGIDRAT
jgi:hypothetical protein